MSVINTNIPSLQAIHNLASNQSDLNTRLERLSTGLKINSGKDDPAGLIASETLRSEMRGISQAIDNSERAMNVLATAEGALNEISSLLLDMRGLINHSANTGAISDDEIAADQLQIDSLIESIDRIADTTQFGGEKLLNGNFEYTVSGLDAADIAALTVHGARVPDDAAKGVTVEVTSSAQTAELTFDATGAGLSENITVEIAGNLGSEVISLTSTTTATNIVTAINASTYATGVSAVVSGTYVVMNSTGYGESASVSVKPIDGTFVVAPNATAKDTGTDASVLINGQTASMDGLKASMRANGLDLELELTAAMATALGTSTFDITGGGATFQIGPEVNPSGQVSVGIMSVATSNLGNASLGYLYSLKSGGANAINADHAMDAEKVVVEAIGQVAVLRGRLGALQKNQIETNINSQQVALENVTAAESAIRDADIAEEAAALTRAQILVQSTTSILGVANQMPQNVLALLG